MNFAELAFCEIRKRVRRALRRYGDAFTRRPGQTEARWAVLSILSGGARTVPQVARRLGVARQSVQRVANLLTAEGLIERGTKLLVETDDFAGFVSDGLDQLRRVLHRDVRTDAQQA